jgi:hypothetical protein
MGFRRIAGGLFRCLGLQPLPLVTGWTILGQNPLQIVLI